MLGYIKNTIGRGMEDRQLQLRTYVTLLNVRLEDVQKSQNVEQAKCCHLEKEVDPLCLGLANNQRYLVRTSTQIINQVPKI